MTGMVVTDAWQLFSIRGQLYETIPEFLDVWLSDISKEAEILLEATKAQAILAVSLGFKKHLINVVDDTPVA